MNDVSGKRSVIVFVLSIEQAVGNNGRCMVTIMEFVNKTTNDTTMDLRSCNLKRERFLTET